MIKKIVGDAFMSLRRGCLDSSMNRPGLTQKKLAERLGVSESTVSDWIQGRYFNYLAHFQKLCGALALSPDDRRELDTLLRGEPNTGVTETPNLDHATWSNEIVERTYFLYRDKPVPALDSPEVIKWLAERYGCAPFCLGKRLIPATILWSNVHHIISPNDVLGTLKKGELWKQRASPLLSETAYEEARTFIKAKYEDGPIKYEGTNYCVNTVDVIGSLPKVNGYFGRYYDNILTQYAMEWELKKALMDSHRLPAERDMPLRRAIERAAGNPLINGSGRVAAITISMLVVFNRPDNAGYYFMIARRSPLVGVSAGLIHVVPAGMFEAFNRAEDWRVDWNLWRELLEEAYDVKEAQVIHEPMMSDKLLTEEPIPYLRELLLNGQAEFSITGVCCDLLNLRTEICSVLFIPDINFAQKREMKLDWEWKPYRGGYARPWGEIDQIISNELQHEPLVASGAVCFGLGREWVRNRHKL